MAELESVGFHPVALEAIERIDHERLLLRQEVEDAEAQLSEWTAKISADGVLDFYSRLRDLVTGRVAQAEGVAAINAALHDSLMGVWLRLEGEESGDQPSSDAHGACVPAPLALHADIRVRPSGDPAYDLLVTELFGTLPSREEAIETLREALPEEFNRGQLLDTEHTRT